MEKNAKIYVAGYYGMVGSALLRCLKKHGYSNVIGHRSREINLTRQDQVERLFYKEKPEYVFMAAAKVGGIHANNTYPAEFIYENLQIECNVIHSAHCSGVKKLLFLGSSCIYPKLAPQPMTEECLLDGKLEPTNEPYAVAKIAGIIMCQSYRRQYGANFICGMPTNLYGPNDNYDQMNSHVLPALIRRFHEAKETRKSEVVIWGTGEPKREFLFVDDLADACVFLMEEYDDTGIVNIGTGEDLTIRELAETVKDVIGYTGRITCDTSKPDGTPRKLLDVSRIKAMGWRPKTSLADGIRKAYEELKTGKVRM